MALPERTESERHEQLVALSDEENRFLRTMLSTVPTGEVKALSTSPFGLWLNHKAPLLFDAAAETATLNRIAQTIERLDSDVLPRLQAGLSGFNAPGNGLALMLREVVAGLEDVRAAVNQLFDRLAGNEGYRDNLTQLFNRPLLASILHREMELARRKRSTFSVMLVDIDHFSEVNQMHGHEAGDRVLQHVATLLASQVRSSDFVFRYGGEEFLILLVELDAAQSLAVAEKIRRTVENANIPLSDGSSLQVTLSLGVALYEGQPDPHSITDLADQALALAKGGGRNRVMLATA
jgi:diguanylate cyclase